METVYRVEARRRAGSGEPIRVLLLSFVFGNLMLVALVLLIWTNISLFRPYFWPIFWALVCSLALWDTKIAWTKRVRHVLHEIVDATERGTINWHGIARSLWHMSLYALYRDFLVHALMYLKRRYDLVVVLVVAPVTQLVFNWYGLEPAKSVARFFLVAGALDPMLEEYARVEAAQVVASRAAKRRHARTPWSRPSTTADTLKHRGRTMSLGSGESLAWTPEATGGGASGGVSPGRRPRHVHSFGSPPMFHTPSPVPMVPGSRLEAPAVPLGSPATEGIARHPWSPRRRTVARSLLHWDEPKFTPPRWRTTNANARAGDEATGIRGLAASGVRSLPQQVGTNEENDEDEEDWSVLPPPVATDTTPRRTHRASFSLSSVGRRSPSRATPHSLSQFTSAATMNESTLLGGHVMDWLRDQAGSIFPSANAEVFWAALFLAYTAYWAYHLWFLLFCMTLVYVGATLLILGVQACQRSQWWQESQWFGSSHQETADSPGDEDAEECSSSSSGRSTPVESLLSTLGSSNTATTTRSSPTTSMKSDGSPRRTGQRRNWSHVCDRARQSAARGASSVAATSARWWAKGCLSVVDACVAAWLVCLLIATVSGVAAFGGLQLYAESRTFAQETRYNVAALSTRAQSWLADAGIAVDGSRSVFGDWEQWNSTTEAAVSWLNETWPAEFETAVVLWAALREIHQQTVESKGMLMENGGASGKSPWNSNISSIEEPVCPSEPTGRISDDSFTLDFDLPALFALFRSSKSWLGVVRDRVSRAGLFPKVAQMESTLLSLGNSVAVVASMVFTASSTVLNGVIHMFLFLALLFYLLAAQQCWLDYILDIFPAQDKAEVNVAMRLTITQVFSVHAKVLLYHALYTWLLFQAFGVHFVYTTTLLSAISGICPFLPTWIISVPAALEVWATEESAMSGFFLWLLHFVWLWFADTYMYEEMQNNHPAMLALSIIAGMGMFGLQGAIIGPLLLSFMVAAFLLLRNQVRVVASLNQTEDPGGEDTWIRHRDDGRVQEGTDRTHSQRGGELRQESVR